MFKAESDRIPTAKEEALLAVRYLEFAEQDRACAKGMVKLALKACGLAAAHLLDWAEAADEPAGYRPLRAHAADL